MRSARSIVSIPTKPTVVTALGVCGRFYANDVPWVCLRTGQLLFRSSLMHDDHYVARTYLKTPC